MDINIGDIVVYGGTQLCRVDSKEDKCFDGVTHEVYIKLVPVDEPGSSYFVREDKFGERTRPLLTKEQVLSVIDSMPRVEAEWVQNKNERRTRFAEILKGDDYSLILCMMKGLYEERGRRSSEGKRLMSADERAFSTARQLLRQEFSTVLGIPEDTVEEFIQSRLAGRE